MCWVHPLLQGRNNCAAAECDRPWAQQRAKRNGGRSLRAGSPMAVAVPGDGRTPTRLRLRCPEIIVFLALSWVALVPVGAQPLKEAAPRCSMWVDAIGGEPVAFPDVLE